MILKDFSNKAHSCPSNYKYANKVPNNHQNQNTVQTT